MAAKHWNAGHRPPLGDVVVTRPDGTTETFTAAAWARRLADMGKAAPARRRTRRTR